jgi:alpha-beta hydrolase superfamily lysophospholipase
MIQTSPRPTVIYNNGFDSTQEDSYVAIGAAALRRGYNVLTFDGPGQGAAIRQQKLVFRPDWEAVTSPVIDYANTRPEIDSKRLALFGYSLGAYLVTRAELLNIVLRLLRAPGNTVTWVPCQGYIKSFLTGSMILWHRDATVRRDSRPRNAPEGQSKYPSAYRRRR